MGKFIAFFISIALSQQIQAMSQETSKAVKEHYGLPNIVIKFSDGEIENQSSKFPGKVSFKDAAIAAMDSFINDGSDDESILFVAIEDVGDIASAKHLHNMLNDDESTFGLVKEARNDLWPQRGEDLSKYWVFYLKNSDLDMTFWALVEREGQGKTYNYGFN